MKSFYLALILSFSFLFYVLPIQAQNSNIYRNGLTILHLDKASNRRNQDKIFTFYENFKKVPLRYENNSLALSVLNTHLSYDNIASMNEQLFGPDTEEIAYQTTSSTSSGNETLDMLSYGLSLLLTKTSINTKTLSKEELSHKYIKEMILEMQEQKVPQRILAQLFNQHPEGYFDMEELKKRGVYSATASEFAESDLTIRNQHSLNDVGLKLINNCYIALTFYDNIESQNEWEKRCQLSVSSNEFEICGDATVYFFHLDINDSILNEFWSTMYVSKSDSIEVRQKKLQKFNNTTFPISVESSAKVWNTHAESYDQFFKATLLEAIDQIEKETEVIAINTSVTSTSFPSLYSKIGTKEGLSTYDRYGFYEIYKGANNKDSLVRKGYCRAKHIENNAGKLYSQTTGSRFTVINGYRPHEGMLLKEKRDVGLSIQSNYLFGYFSGPEIQISFGKYYRGGIECALDLSQGPYIYVIKPYEIELNQRLLRTGLFLQRIFYARNVSLAFNIAGGMEFDIQSYDNKDVLQKYEQSTDNPEFHELDYDNNTEHIHSYYYKIGSEVSYGCYRVQFVGGASFSQSIFTQLPSDFDNGGSVSMQNHSGLLYYGGIRINL